MIARKTARRTKAQSWGARLLERIEERKKGGFPVFTMPQYEAAESLLRQNYDLELLEWCPVGSGKAFIELEGTVDTLVRHHVIAKDQTPPLPKRLYWERGLTVRRARDGRMAVRVNAWLDGEADHFKETLLGQFLWPTAAGFPEAPRSRSHLRLIWSNPAARSQQGERA